MATTTQRSTTARTQRGTSSRKTTQTRQAAPKSPARQVAERTVDVPVGVALTAVDRVGEILEPWTSRTAAERELRSYRSQITRTFTRAERRGATARRKATTRAKRTRTQVERQVRRVEREVRKNRRKAETTLRQNRRKAETALRRSRRNAEQQLRKVERRAERVQAGVGDVVETQTARAQELAGRLNEQISTLT